MDSSSASRVFRLAGSKKPPELAQPALKIGQIDLDVRTHKMKWKNVAEKPQNAKGYFGTNFSHEATKEDG
ncbi:MAG: hypothetical protein PHD76_11160 [Methylacidiphilales bacterium]|nr:hypothetical protein [Candidatus Methylacidiphilales bacterium]